MKTQRGYTLIETLVAMLILVMLSTSGLYGWQYWQQSQRLWQTASQARDYLLYLREDANWHNRDHSISVIREGTLWCLVSSAAGANTCHGSCTGEGLEIVGQGDCVIVQWDANSNGIWDREPVKESDQIGFRLKEHVLETLRGATSCEGKGWDKVTNPDAIIIDNFQVVRQDVSGFSPVLTVNMHAASKADPQTVVDASYSVTGFNL
ncbi:prepilin peptidase-dependent protein [Escherichia coli]|nr:prepilin peptidase-dependent protein [Escherichia coli]